MIDMRSWPKKWNDASLRRIVSLPDKWNEASLRRIVSLPERSSPGAWPLVGMFALGLMAGAIGCYAITQRSGIRRLAMDALDMGDDSDSYDEVDAASPDSLISRRSNHRRKATTEVK